MVPGVWWEPGTENGMSVSLAASPAGDSLQSDRTLRKPLAMIAKIPFELARHIAAVYYPRTLAQIGRLAAAAGKS